MSQRPLFRILLATVLVTIIGRKAFEFPTLATVNALEFAEQTLDGFKAANDHLRVAQLQTIVNASFLLLIIPIFYSLVLKQLDKRRLWWLSFPVAIILSAVLAIGLAHIDRWLNPYYYISFSLVKDGFPTANNFLRLQLVNFFYLLNACLFAGFIFKVEQLFFDQFDSLKKRLGSTSSLFWLSLFFVCFIIGLLIHFQFRSSESIRSITSVVQQNIWLTFWATFVGLFFLDHYFHRGKIRIHSSFNEIFKFLFSSFGCLGGIVLILFSRYESLQGMNLYYIHIFITGLGLIVFSSFICYCLYLANVGGIRSKTNLRLSLEQKTTELDFLKSQVNPHFLFNSLNTVYGIALSENSPKTANGVQMLSGMMRFMLRENTEQQIPVAKEIDYIHHYIELQSLRLTGSETVLNIELNRGCKGNIAPMILIPFIENAFKHGVSVQDSSFINIRLECSPEHVGLFVKNSKHTRSLPENETSGIGLKNVKDRLLILYPDKHMLVLNEDDDTFEVKLKVRLR